MIILPTLGRPENIKRFVEAYRSTFASLPVLVVFDAGDALKAEYEKIGLPASFDKIFVPARTRCAAIQNLVFEKWPNEEFYAVLADDVVPETEKWDKELAEACRYEGIAWGDDDIQHKALATHPFIDGDLVRKMGWIAPPGLVHFFVDNVWTHLAAAIGGNGYLPDVKLTHHHHLNGKAVMDSTYRNATSFDADYVAYRAFMKNDFEALLKRVRA